MSRDWLNGLKQLTVPEILIPLGLTKKRLGTLGPCPLCSAASRSNSDKRGPLGLNGNKKGVKCHACNEKIDIVDLVAIAATGSRFKDLPSGGHGRMKDFAESQGWVRAGSTSGSTAHKRVKSIGATVDELLNPRGKRAAKEPESEPSADKPKRKRRKIKGVKSGGSSETEPKPKARRGGFSWEPAVYAATADVMFTAEGAGVLRYATEGRKLSLEAVKFWKLGAHLMKDETGRVVEEYLVIPLPDELGKVVNYRFRSVPGPCLHCQTDTLGPIPGDGWERVSDCRCSICRGMVWGEVDGPKTVCRLGHAGDIEPEEAEPPRGPGCDKCTKKDREGNIISIGTVLKKYRPCTGRPLPLFGSHLLSADRKLPVITIEGELDVVAAWDYGYKENCVSGTAGAETFKDPWLDLLEPYLSHIVGHDDDEAGAKGADSFATKIGRYRCSRLILPENDFGACLQEGVTETQIERAIEMAGPMTGVEFCKTDHFADELEVLINNPDKLKGLPTASPKLTMKLGGWRPGLTVWTGDTGSGKTTLTHWLLMRMAKDHGTGVAITSFEQKPIGSVQKLLRQELENDFTKVSREARLEALKSLGRLPLWILNHYGHMSFSKVVNSIRYASRRHGCRGFLIDHLGFLIPEDEDDERKAVERIIRALTILANNEEIMIWLVVHPSNAYVKQRRRVMLVDLKGASAIRQDANEGFVVVRNKPNKKRPWFSTSVFGDKVRSEFGTAGFEVVLAFDPLATVYADSPSELPTYKGGGVVVDPKSV